MPRSRKTEKIKKRPESAQDMQQDHEQFLLTFEKPTQIYRFLRARQILSPTFLHRTLLYMPQRCSRTNSRRKKFVLNDLLKLAKADEGNLLRNEDKKYENLQISVASLLLDPMKKDPLFRQGGKNVSTVDVEVVMVRSILNKRKDIDNATKEISYGVIEVPVNPKTNSDGSTFIDDVDSCVVICTDDFVKWDAVDGSTKSLILKFCVRKISSESDESADSSSSISEAESDEDAENVPKKRKTEEDESEDEDDPAGISLKNLKTGPRKRRSRYVSSREDNTEEESERNTRSKETKVEPVKKPTRVSYHYFKPLVKMNANLNHEILAEAELLLFNSEFECQAHSGSYELVLNKKGQENVDYKRKAVWESFNGGQEIKVYDSFTTPTLKFGLKWVESSNYGPFADSVVEDEVENTTMFGTSERCTRTSRQNLTNGDSNEGRILTAVDLVEYRKSRLRQKSYVPNLDNGFDGLNSSDRVFYQFMYNNNTQQQTESRDDFVCPWCQLNCMALYGLMKHLKLCHPRFLFRYSQQTKGTVIVVTVNECYDGSYAGNPRNIFCQPGMAFSRRGPVRRIPVTDVLVFRPDRTLVAPNGTLAELLDREDIEALEPTQMSTGHRRLYFHSLTTLPVRPCEFDSDSEDEATEPDWLFGHTKRMIDEFTDVNEGEKALMKLWNLHIMRNSCISDTQIEDESKRFIDQNIGHLVKHSLRRNLLLHFICLVDFGVFKSSNVLTLMKYFDDAEETYRKCGKIDEDIPDLTAPNFPEPDLLPRFKKLRNLIEKKNHLS